MNDINEVEYIETETNNTKTYEFWIDDILIFTKEVNLITKEKK